MKIQDKFEITKMEITDFDGNAFFHDKYGQWVQRVWIKFEVNGQVKRHLVYFYLGKDI